MKILISNYRYFISGGPERYLFNVKNELEKNGHEVYPFSIRSQQNVESEYDSYFMSPIGSEQTVYFDEYKKDLKTIFQILSRQFYSPEGYFKAKKIAQLIQPDIIYILHFLNKMSPSILNGFNYTKAPIVLRISDFGLICPQAHLFQGGKICESCIANGFLPVIKNSCVKNSRIGSIIKYLSWTLHKMLGIVKKVDGFVFPSKFTRGKFLKAGFPAEKLFYIPTFVNADEITPKYVDTGHILYFGRLDYEKGVHVLLEAYSKMPLPKPPIIIIGDIHKNEYTKNLVSTYNSKVEFHDFMSKEQLSGFIKDALFTVVPSLCYDNLPNVLLEAYSFGKAVIASNHGCFPEFIKDKTTGLLFQPNDSNDLCKKMTWASSNATKMKIMGKNARSYVLKEHNPELHLNRLLKLFSTISNNHKNKDTF